MPHKLKKSVEHIDQKGKKFGTWRWRELGGASSQAQPLPIISTMSFPFPSARTSKTNLPIWVDTALEGKASSGNIHLVPYCPFALAHPGRQDQELNSDHGGMFYLRFVSSSAPTLRSALHFCKGHMYCETFQSKGNKVCPPFSKVCQLFSQLLYLEVCCIYRASIADWACHGEVTACIPGSKSITSWIHDTGEAVPCNPRQDSYVPTRYLWGCLVGQFCSNRQLGGHRLEKWESASLSHGFHLLEILFFFTWR